MAGISISHYKKLFLLYAIFLNWFFKSFRKMFILRKVTCSPAIQQWVDLQNHSWYMKWMHLVVKLGRLLICNIQKPFISSWIVNSATAAILSLHVLEIECQTNICIWTNSLQIFILSESSNTAWYNKNIVVAQVSGNSS